MKRNWNGYRPAPSYAGPAMKLIKHAEYKKRQAQRRRIADRQDTIDTTTNTTQGDTE